MKLCTHLRLVLRLGISGVIHLNQLLPSCRTQEEPYLTLHVLYQETYSRVSSDLREDIRKALQGVIHICVRHKTRQMTDLRGLSF